MFESLIEVQALSNQISIDWRRFFQEALSSFILSKIRIFASTAIQIESIIQATQAKVITIGIQNAQEIFNNQSRIAEYATSATDAITHSSLYW